LIRKSEFVKRTKEPIPAPVACKHSSSPIAAVSCWSESNEENLCLGIAETWEGFSPIRAPFKSPGFQRCDVLAPTHKPRAAVASDDTSLKLFELGHLVLNEAEALS
jgi:hypothetical protein